jgi:pyruvate dehydrogenase E2 component (dihydrolipoamide acetyltransferase)
MEEILVPEGQTVPIGQPIARIGDGVSSNGAAPSQPAQQAPGQAQPSGQGQPPAQATNPSGQPAATPQVAAEADQAIAPGQDATGPREEAAVLGDQQLAVDEAQPSDQLGGQAQGGQAQPRPADGAAVGAEPISVASDEDGVRASPMARRIARERGIDLRAVRGSGPGGRVIRVDVESATPGQQEPAARAAPTQAAPAQAQPAAQAAPQQAPRPSPAPAIGADQEVEEIPLNNIRRITGQRMVESLQTAPHFFLTSVIDATELVKLRKQINAELEKAGDETRVSVNDLIVKACALTLRAVPAANAAFGGDKILRLKRIHVGIAVATDNGLIVPVVRDADQKSIGQLAREARGLIDRSLAGRLMPAEFSGGTFTVSNLGMFGVEHFTAVINPPQAGILAVGAVASEPVALDGQVQIRERMRVTLSVDHRVLDGADGAKWLQKLKGLLEAPMRMLVQ